MNQAQQCLLVGLPGSGKRRLAQQIVNLGELSAEQVLTDRVLLADVVKVSAPITTWLVLDARANLSEHSTDMLSVLEKLLSVAQGVILNFHEQVELEQQSQWASWVRQHDSDVKLVRTGYSGLPDSFQPVLEIGCPPEHLVDVQADLVSLRAQRFEYEVKRVMLDHLLMGLDGARRNLAMPIFRVQATLNTFEYENVVQVEGTPTRLDCYAAEENQAPGTIVIEGRDLDQAWLSELVAACQLSP